MTDHKIQVLSDALGRTRDHVLCVSKSRILHLATKVSKHPTNSNLNELLDTILAEAHVKRYSGLEDSHDKPIMEGDIVEHLYAGEWKKYKVVFDYGGYCFSPVDKSDGATSMMEAFEEWGGDFYIDK